MFASKVDGEMHLMRAGVSTSGILASDQMLIAAEMGFINVIKSYESGSNPLSY